MSTGTKSRIKTNVSLGKSVSARTSRYDLRGLSQDYADDDTCEYHSMGSRCDSTLIPLDTGQSGVEGVPALKTSCAPSIMSHNVVQTCAASSVITVFCWDRHKIPEPSRLVDRSGAVQNSLGLLKSSRWGDGLSCNWGSHDVSLSIPSIRNGDEIDMALQEHLFPAADANIKEGPYKYVILPVCPKDLCFAASSGLRNSR